MEQTPATLEEIAELLFYVILGIADHSVPKNGELALQIGGLVKFFRETADDVPDKRVKWALHKLAQNFFPAGNT